MQRVKKIKSIFTWRGGFIAETEGSARRRMVPRPEN